MFTLILLFAVTLIGLARSVLIIAGLYKDPILRSFEQYGDDERLPMPLVTLVGWAGTFVITLGFWTGLYLGATYPMIGLGILLLLACGLGLWNYPFTSEWHYKLAPFPTWHHELRGRTTRYERRRIAYMWLHLPWKSRLTYNSSDKLFFQWADFVIMGTVREEEKDIYDEAFYAGR